MKTRTVITGTVAALLLLGLLPLQAAERYAAKSGGKVRIEGDSSMHKWQVESKLIGGTLEVGENFPTAPGKELKPGKLDAKVDAFIPVRSLKSVKADGTPYMDAMDDIMYEKLLVEKNPRILFKLSELELKEPAKSKDAPYVCEAKGELTVAGAAKAVTIPVTILPVDANTLKISGSIPSKMSDFNITTPKPTGIPITTADEVKLIFEWVLGKKAPGAK